ncbi:alpha/beta hydrolase [Serratia quinivorans]|uniref:alpha/beta hydrolase n=1 Tax=Serratia quinivorans TaxID=137545 RepID=UPI002177A592|nr:alpha/beta hydrolase [Serratia quinivorans]CAI1177630.1 Uncharacterized conserved protein [Serratia quinivorans]
MRMDVSFPSDGANLAGHLYLPSGMDMTQCRPALVVVHPFGGVKEQTAGLYAKKLAERGFITLAFDARYQGESGGEPRYLEDPFARVEDIKNAVTYLSNHTQIDADKIGVLGICAGGGYVPFAAQTDHRIRAVATVSASDIGTLFREGLNGNAAPEVLASMLDESAKARTAEGQGEPPSYYNIVPDSAAEITPDTPSLYAEGSNYYRTSRAQHPNSPNLFLKQSVDRIAQYSSYDFIHLISPRPLLMIAGSEADTRYFSEMAVFRANEPKELFLIEGASHIALYDQPEYVNSAVEKITTFFAAHLSSN